MDPITIVTLVGGTIKLLAEVIAIARDDPRTPEEEKAKLDEISLRLEATEVAVAAVQLPSGN